MNNIHAVDLGVNVEVFHPEPDDAMATRHSLDISPDSCLLLSCRTAGSGKEHPDPVRCLRPTPLGAEPARYHLLVVGDGLQRAEMLKLQEASWAPDLAPIFNRFDGAGPLLSRGRIVRSSRGPGNASVSPRSRARPAARRWLAFAGAIWTGSSLGARNTGRRKILRARWPTRLLRLRAARLRENGLAAAATVREHYAWEVVFARLFQIYREVKANYRDG